MRPPTIRSKDLRKFSIIPFKAVMDKELHGTSAFTVLALLCSYCDEIGRTFVSNARLAKDLGVSRPAINRQLKRLKDMGYITYGRPQYKGQTTRTWKVIYDDITDEDEARANLNAAEQISLAERERELEHSTSKAVDNSNQDQKGVTPGGYTSKDEHVTPGGYTTCNAQRLHIPDHITDSNSNIIEEARKNCVMFLRVAEAYGTPRVLNDRDIDTMKKWIQDGLKQEDWGQILKQHAEYCRSKHRDMARGIGYFQIPVSKSLGKSANKRVDNTIIGVAKRLRR